MSRNAMPDPSTVARSTQRAVAVPHVTNASPGADSDPASLTRTIVPTRPVPVNWPAHDPCSPTLMSLKKSWVVVDTSLLAAIISLQPRAVLPGRTDEAKAYAAFV